MSILSPTPGDSQRKQAAKIHKEFSPNVSAIRVAERALQDSMLRNKRRSSEFNEKRSTSAKKGDTNLNNQMSTNEL